jgi:hypothetical protein
MAALSARCCNPLIQVFADRLMQAGKLPKVILVTCMRKLLTLMNTMLKNNSPWFAENALEPLPSEPDLSVFPTHPARSAQTHLSSETLPSETSDLEIP